MSDKVSVFFFVLCACNLQSELQFRRVTHFNLSSLSTASEHLWTRQAYSTVIISTVSVMNFHPSFWGRLLDSFSLPRTIFWFQQSLSSPWLFDCPRVVWAESLRRQAGHVVFGDAPDGLIISAITWHRTFLLKSPISRKRRRLRQSF